MLWPRMLRSLARRPLTGPAPAPQPETVAALAGRLEGAARRRLGRSLAIRAVDAGSCNGCELEIAALQGVTYDLERFGLRFVASPRHADVLLVTGPMSRAMTEAAQRAHAAMGDPSWVVAVGDCALGGGVFAGTYAVEDGIGAALPVDLVIPGCPPSPALLLEGLLTLIEAESGAPPPEPPPPAMPGWAEDPAAAVDALPGEAPQPEPLQGEPPRDWPRGDWPREEWPPGEPAPEAWAPPEPPLQKPPQEPRPGELPRQQRPPGGVPSGTQGEPPPGGGAPPPLAADPRWR